MSHEHLCTSMSHEHFSMSHEHPCENTNDQNNFIQSSKSLF
jgi:hypothetical protein